MKKLTVLGDAPVSETIWNTPKELTKPLKKQTTNESSIDTWVSDGEDSDTVTSENTEEDSSQESDTEPSTTLRMGPSQEPTRANHGAKCGTQRESKMGTNPKNNTKTK